MRQRFGWKRLHSTLCDTPRITQPVGQNIQLPLRPENMRQSFFSIDYVLRSGVALLRHERSEHSTLCCHRIDRVLHHGKLARSYRAQRGVAARRDAYGMLNLFPWEMQSASGDKG